MDIIWSNKISFHTVNCRTQMISKVSCSLIFKFLENYNELIIYEQKNKGAIIRNVYMNFY